MKLYNMWSFVVDSSVFDGFLKNIYLALIYVSLMANEAYILPWWLSGKESACNVGDTGAVPGLERSPGEGNGFPFQYSCLKDPVDRGA